MVSSLMDNVAYNLDLVKEVDLTKLLLFAAKVRLAACIDLSDNLRCCALIISQSVF